MNPTSKKLGVLKIFLFGAVLQMFLYAGPGSSEALAENMFKIGLLHEPKTLNIWLASDRWSRKVLSQLYQPLYIREPASLNLVPWLAADEPVYDPATLSYTIKLRPSKWSDGSELTSEDVAFTGRFIKKFKVPKYLSLWEFVKKIETPDKHTVRFFLKDPKAIFLTRTLTTPIVQKKEWAKVSTSLSNSEKPIEKLSRYPIDKPVSSGPFVLKEWKLGEYLLLESNNRFFGKGKTIAGKLLGPNIDGIVFKFFHTSDAAFPALEKGEIDMFWWGLQQENRESLQQKQNIQLYTNKRSALYYLGFNLRKKPFNDINFRQAVATLIDKDDIIGSVLHGDAFKMDSIVPFGNRFWYYPGVAKYGEGLSREARVRKAYEILSNAGYTWEMPPLDADGNLVEGKRIILPDGSPMRKVTILTPTADYDSQRFSAGMMIQNWLKMVGIPASSKPMEFGSLINRVKERHHFDLFVLGYGKLSLDPDYLRSFFHSRNDRPRGWNMSGYKNPDFDRIADESAGVMDVEKRRELIWKMQAIIMRDVPYLPLYNPRLTEGVRIDKFTGWVEMLDGIGNIWSFCRIRLK